MVILSNRQSSWYSRVAHYQGLVIRSWLFSSWNITKLGRLRVGHPLETSILLALPSGTSPRVGYPLLATFLLEDNQAGTSSGWSSTRNVNPLGSPEWYFTEGWLPTLGFLFLLEDHQAGTSSGWSSTRNVNPLGPSEWHYFLGLVIHSKFFIFPLERIILI